MTWHGKDVNEHWGLLCSIPAKVRHPAVGSCWGLIIYVPAPLCSCCLILSMSVTHFALSFKLIVFSFIFPFFIYFILHISWCFIQSFYQRGPPTVVNSVTSHLMSSAIKGRCFNAWCYSHLGRIPRLQSQFFVLCIFNIITSAFLLLINATTE